MARKKGKQAGEIRTKVVGVTFDNPDGSSRQALIRQHVRAGDKVMLRYAPIDRDSNAVEVLVKGRRGCLSLGRRKPVQIGYLRSELAAELHQQVRAGRVSGRVMEVTGGQRDKPNRGVNLLLRIDKR